ncbi:MAG: hypothetical protein HFI75_15425 [Lachnospiraceae bacterium]|nr:hypothetical protein [Lachnospiraceae bacterium]
MVEKSELPIIGADILEKQVYTRDIAAQIVENFENVLEEQDITLTSPEDDEKEPDNAARLYGSTYCSLLDVTEAIIIQTLEQAGISHDKYIADQFSGNF